MFHGGLSNTGPALAPYRYSNILPHSPWGDFSRGLPISTPALSPSRIYEVPGRTSAVVTGSTTHYTHRSVEGLAGPFLCALRDL